MCCYPARLLEAVPLLEGARLLEEIRYLVCKNIKVNKENKAQTALVSVLDCLNQ